MEGVTTSMNAEKTGAFRFGEVRVRDLCLGDYADALRRCRGSKENCKSRRTRKKMRRLINGVSSINLYTWHPAAKLFSQLPGNFQLDFYCLECPKFGRVLVPAKSSPALIPNLFTGGLAIHDHLSWLTNKQRVSYRYMLLIYQRTRKLRNYYGKRFQHMKDLQAYNSRILPDDVGVSPTGSGFPWEASKLKHEGRKLAQENGVTCQTEADLIEYGLFAAAKENPLSIEDIADVKKLIRLATFDHVSTFSYSNEVKKWVKEQILMAINSHRDDSQNKFDKWFSGSSNTFLKQIARKKWLQKKLASAQKDSALDMVRNIFLEFGWDAYFYVAQCVHVQMKCILNTIPEPFNAQEQKRFEMYYLKQKCFGDLPYIMLGERIPFLSAPVESILNGRNNFDFPGTIYRLLYFYSEMSEARRKYDRNPNRYTTSIDPLADKAMI